MAQVFLDIDGDLSPTLEDLVDKAFYGARQDILTGKAVIDTITGDAPIRLPNPNNVRPDDYVNWMWSNNTFRFNWDTETGHLLMEVL
jgi:hypothetical protein